MIPEEKIAKTLFEIKKEFQSATWSTSTMSSHSFFVANVFLQFNNELVQ